MTAPITIHVARNLADAVLLKGRLESAGIPALVPGSFAMGYGLLEVPDTRVQVLPEHEASARQIAESWEQAERAD